MRVAAGVLVALAAPPAAAAPIIGGSATTPSDYPAVAVISAGRALCTGELIDPEWVMTAAHCLDPVELKLQSQKVVTEMTSATFGTVDAGSGGTYIHADATYLDPAWDDQHFGKHDLGLIHLGSAYTGAAPMVVNFKASRAPIGIVVTMVGFGTTASGSDVAGVEYQLGGQKSESCGDFKTGGGATLDDGDLLCFTQVHEQGTCEGDSGGPLIAMIDGAPTIVGVTSYGDQDCVEFGAYTRTDREIDFVEANLPALCAGDACIDDAAAAAGCCDARGGGAPTAALSAALLALVTRRRR